MVRRPTVCTRCLGKVLTPLLNVNFFWLKYRTYPKDRYLHQQKMFERESPLFEFVREKKKEKEAYVKMKIDIGYEKKFSYIEILLSYVKKTFTIKQFQDTPYLSLIKTRWVTYCWTQKQDLAEETVVKDFLGRPDPAFMEYHKL